MGLYEEEVDVLYIYLPQGRILTTPANSTLLRTGEVSLQKWVIEGVAFGRIWPLGGSGL